MPSDAETKAVFETRYYASSTYWFGSKVVFSVLYVHNFACGDVGDIGARALSA